MDIGWSEESRIVGSAKVLSIENLLPEKDCLFLMKMIIIFT